MEDNRCKYRIRFKNKYVFFQTPVPRIGVCNWCRAVVGIDCIRTSLHHESYHPENPLKDTIEVCARCHGKTRKGWDFLNNIM